MTSYVSRVACMRLLGGDASLSSRGARNCHDSQAASKTRGLNHAPPATRNCFLS
jgi:hypothetical protein